MQDVILHKNAVKFLCKMPLCKMENFGKILDRFLCKFSIDKFCAMWYNGEFGLAQPRAGRSKVNPQKFTKIHSKLCEK